MPKISIDYHDDLAKYNFSLVGDLTEDEVAEWEEDFCYIFDVSEETYKEMVDTRESFEKLQADLNEKYLSAYEPAIHKKIHAMSKAATVKQVVRLGKTYTRPPFSYDEEIQ